MRLLDGYCCAGGASKGYADAGFEVEGVDIADQPHYPFTFHRANAVQWIMYHFAEYDAIHVSPPCQDHSALTLYNRKAKRGWSDNFTNWIDATREVLRRTGKPYVIENVKGAPIRHDLTLCGEYFGLEVTRHRYFELGGWWCPQPPHVRHRGATNGYRHGVRQSGPYYAVYGSGGGKGSLEDWQRAMGMPWVPSRRHLAEAIPPAYTEYIGANLMLHLQAEADKRAA